MKLTVKHSITGVLIFLCFFLFAGCWYSPNLRQVSRKERRPQRIVWQRTPLCVFLSKILGKLHFVVCLISLWYNCVLALFRQYSCNKIGGDCWLLASVQQKYPMKVTLGCHSQRKASGKKLVFSRSGISQGILHQVREINIFDLLLGSMRIFWRWQGCVVSTNASWFLWLSPTKGFILHGQWKLAGNPDIMGQLL